VNVRIVKYTLVTIGKAKLEDAIVPTIVILAWSISSVDGVNIRTVQNILISIGKEKPEDAIVLTIVI
jgi:hypothetical protein